MLRTFETTEELYKKFKSTCAREGTSVKEALNVFIENYVKEHGDSGNPQTTLTQYKKEEVMAIPNLYEEDIKKWQKFFKHKNFDKKEYQLLDRQHKMFTKMMNTKFTELFE